MAQELHWTERRFLEGYTLFISQNTEEYRLLSFRLAYALMKQQCRNRKDK
jgi:hypothetical protein